MTASGPPRRASLLHSHSGAKRGPITLAIRSTARSSSDSVSRRALTTARRLSGSVPAAALVREARELLGEQGVAAGAFDDRGLQLGRRAHQLRERVRGEWAERERGARRAGPARATRRCARSRPAARAARRARARRAPAARATGPSSHWPSSKASSSGARRRRRSTISSRSASARSCGERPLGRGASPSSGASWPARRDRDQLARGVAPGAVGEVAPERPAAAAQYGHAALACGGHERVEQVRLADPGLAGDGQDRALAGRRALEQAERGLELALAADQRRARRPRRPAARRPPRTRRPVPARPRSASGAERLRTPTVAGAPACRLGGQDLARAAPRASAARRRSRRRPAPCTRAAAAEPIRPQQHRAGADADRGPGSSWRASRARAQAIARRSSSSCATGRPERRLQRAALVDGLDLQQRAAERAERLERGGDHAPAGAPARRDRPRRRSSKRQNSEVTRRCSASCSSRPASSRAATLGCRNGAAGASRSGAGQAAVRAVRVAGDRAPGAGSALGGGGAGERAAEQDVLEPHRGVADDGAQPARRRRARPTARAPGVVYGRAHASAARLIRPKHGDDRVADEQGDLAAVLVHALHDRRRTPR